MQADTAIEKLHKFGLNTYEARAYFALLEKNRLTATKVAAIARIPRARVYDTLENLLAKGLCAEIPGKHKSYIATNPGDFREALLLSTEQEVDRQLRDVQEGHNKLARDLEERHEKLALELQAKQQKLLLEKKERLTELDALSRLLIPLYESGRSDKLPLDYIEIIRDMRLAARKFLEISGRVEFEALHFVKGPFSGGRKELEEQVDLQCQRAKGKHVRARALYQIADEGEEWLYEFIETAATAGDEEARILGNLPLKGAIIDEKIIIMALHDPIRSQVSFTTMVIEHADLAKALKMAFEALWDQAEDYRAWKAQYDKRR